MNNDEEKTWLDGQLVQHTTGITFDNTGTHGIDKHIFNNFHGGSSDGFDTTCSEPSVLVMWYSTDGAVEMSDRPNSRSSRSRTISMWSRPRKPQRKPKPSAPEVSGS